MRQVSFADVSGGVRMSDQGGREEDVSECAIEQTRRATQMGTEAGP